MRRGNFALSALLVLGGCVSGYEGSMKTQSGENVSVYKDSFMYLGGVGTPYYYEDGAKVYVNETDSDSTNKRKTQWSNEYDPK
jgi:hypothetical protein